MNRTEVCTAAVSDSPLRRQLLHRTGFYQNGENNDNRFQGTFSIQTCAANPFLSQRRVFRVNSARPHGETEAILSQIRK